MEVNPRRGHNASLATPLDRPADPMEAKRLLPFRMQKIKAERILDQWASAMPPRSSAIASTHSLSPSGVPKFTAKKGFIEPPPSNFPRQGPVGITVYRELDWLSPGADGKRAVVGQLQRIVRPRRVHP